MWPFLVLSETFRWVGRGVDVEARWRGSEGLYLHFSAKQISVFWVQPRVL